MSAGIHHAMLGLACLALIASGNRLAARLSDRPLDRVVTAFVFAAAAAVGEALLLGLVGLGADTTALSIAAGVTYGGSRAILPLPQPSTASGAREWLRSLGPRALAAVGALAALGLLVLAWSLHAPAIGFDGAVYHLPDVAAWVANGRPGSIVSISYLFPFANYPITNEVLLTWGVGISRGLVPIVLWSQVVFVMTVAASVLGLRAIGVNRWTTGLTIAALVATPVLLQELGTPSSDLPALCWLVCCAALVARTRERPQLAYAAVVAAGLAVGTKTSAVPLVLVVVFVGAWSLRSRIRLLPAALALAFLVATGVGGVWYLRNLVDHGSPLWPFQALPGGDPVPHVWSLIDHSLLERPGATVRPRVSGYLEAVAGTLLLVAAAPFAWLVSRARPLVFASIVSAGAALVWAAAPSTGEPDTRVFDVNVISTTRYALPAFAAAAVAVALAASSRGRLAWVARGLLAAALAWSLVRDAAIDFVQLPSGLVLVAGCVGGAAGTLITSRSRALERLPRAPRGVMAIGPALMAVILGGALALAATGLVARHTTTLPSAPGAQLESWAVRQPGFDHEQPIHFLGTVLGPLTGDRLQHRLILVSRSATCTEVRGYAAHGVLVVADEPVFRALGVPTAAACAGGLTPTKVFPGVRVYGSLDSGASGSVTASLANAGP